MSDDMLVAQGGFCAPVSPMYDLIGRSPWLLRDLSPFRDTDMDALVAPRLTILLASWADVRTRIRRAVDAFRAPIHVDEDDWFS